MRLYTLFCSCGCAEPLRMTNGFQEAIPVFRSLQLAQLRASELHPVPIVGEIEIKRA